MNINVRLVTQVPTSLILPTRLPVPSIAVRLRVRPPGRDGTKTRPHKQVRIGPIIVARHGIVQEAGKDEAIGELRRCSVLPKTKCDFKIITLTAAVMDSESTAGGVKINILPPP